MQTCMRLKYEPSSEQDHPQPAANDDAIFAKLELSIVEADGLPRMDIMKG